MRGKRGDDRQVGTLFSYVDLEARVPAEHPLRPMRELVDAALEEISPAFEALYARTGRPSIPPERLLRALLLQVLFTVRSQRQLMSSSSTTCCIGGSWGWASTTWFG